MGLPYWQMRLLGCGNGCLKDAGFLTAMSCRSGVALSNAAENAIGIAAVHRSSARRRAGTRSLADSPARRAGLPQFIACNPQLVT
ncbi:hypothetical protein DQQ10_22580 [Pseudochryseolinea flava]|uniref:Uncharacterized protein n=1 Tax=Pseudochryseolinea flava TaxID=2059302 RepID=A0A364XYY5_9BACT|nr:hypothetical protein DQQ10_22580 [Pseudochryseolinea flava]